MVVAAQTTGTQFNSLRITNVDQSFIYNFKIILISLTCQQVLDLEKFETFCFDTANLYMTKYMVSHACNNS